MASVNLQKHMTKTACCGIARHNYRDGRNHSNPDIDPTRTHLNKHYGPQTSAEFRAKYHEMVKEFDRRIPPKRKKQDRKTSLGLNIPSPREGMTPEQEAAWSKAAYKKIEELFPGQVVGGTYHADEVHKYIVDKQEHTSRGHTHVEVIPWTDQYGLNMDKFYKRDLPNRINAALDELCQEMYGHPYRDGTQAKSKGRVEKLKAESAAEERKQEEAHLEQVQMQVLDMQDVINSKREEAEKVAEEVYKPYIEAQERLIKQFEALKPQDRTREKSEIEKLLKESNRVFGKGNPKEIIKATAALEQESSRIESTYLSIADDDDFGMDLD